MATGVNRHGLTELYTPKGRAAADVIFVHGLFGHPYETWTCELSSDVPKRPSSEPASTSVPQKSAGGISSLFRRRDKHKAEGSEDNLQVPRTPSRSSSTERGRSSEEPAKKEIFWPRDLLPKLVPNIRIFTFGYDVDIVHFNPFGGAAGQASVYQHAKTLLNDVSGVRTGEDESQRPIIFVVHSLGGIVVKDALGQSRAERTHLNQILPATVGVCFLGTPHRGSGTATLGKIAAELSKILLKHPNIQVLKTLEVNSTELERIGMGFAQILVDQRIKVHSFYEEYRTKGIMVVQNFSYSIGDGLETSSGIPASHSDMTKFEKSTSEGLQRIVKVLRRWLPTGGGISDTDMCLDSLNVFETRYRLAEVEKTFGNTYQWVFTDDVTFNVWLSDENAPPLYWIKGKAGSGKSTLMKYVLQNPKTVELLYNRNSEKWILAGFFFHDRGAGLQKSISGLLSAILYKVLLPEPNLLQFVLPIFRRGPYDRAKRIWMVEELTDAFLAILQQQKVKINLCLFVDALDEHDGDHKALLDLLQRIGNQPKEAQVQLKLCLASREEPIFEAALEPFLGFAMQDKTFSDIQAYTFGRIGTESPKTTISASLVDLQTLSTEITIKSRGVFIWVKLAVDDMMNELWAEGGASSMLELRRVLSNMPTELEALYQRILSRLTKRLDRATAARARRETYVMFQIALTIRSPIPLAYFINATSLLTTGEPAKFNLNEYRQPRPTPEMNIRLNSRCGGLLEPVVGHQYDSSNNRETVQFIHQTAKEFMVKKMQAPEVLKDILGEKYENGHLLLLRYCLMVVRKDMDVRIPDFAYHARLAETALQESNSQEFDHLFTQGSADPLRDLTNFCSYLDFDKSFGQLRIKTSNPDLWLLLMAIYAGLFFLFQAKFGVHIWSNHGYLEILWEGAIRAFVNGTEFFPDSRFIELLLSKGIDPDGKNFDGRTALQWILRLSTDSTDHLHPIWEMDDTFRIIDLLLEYGADPNQTTTRAFKTVSPLHAVIGSFIQRVPPGTVQQSGVEKTQIKGFGTANFMRLDSLVLYKIVETLVKHGAELNPPPDGPDPPTLQLIVDLKHKSLAQLLLQNGARPVALGPPMPEAEAQEWRQIFSEYYKEKPTRASRWSGSVPIHSAWGGILSNLSRRFGGNEG